MFDMLKTSKSWCKVAKVKIVGGNRFVSDGHVTKSSSNSAFTRTLNEGELDD